MVDQPKTIGALVIAIAQNLGIDVVYLPGLTMRRVADLHPGQAKTVGRGHVRQLLKKHAPRLAEQLQQLDRQRFEVEAEILQAVDAHPLAEVLTSMPGVGVRTAARILTEVVGKRHNQAVIALARRRVDVLFAMIRDGSFYQEPAPPTVALAA